jgi:hypothetical protein
MTFDPTSQITVGGFALLALWLVLKFKPWRNGAVHKDTTPGIGALGLAEWEMRTRQMMASVLAERKGSGAREAGEWEVKLREICDAAAEESNVRLKAYFDGIMAARNEAIRRILREELDAHGRV